MKLLLSLLILLPFVGTVTAVAGCRSDKDKDHRPRENCTAAGFSDIPGLELSTKVLLFPSNLFSSLSWSSFQIFEEIYEIDLTDNKVPEVTPTGSAVLPTLSVLRLGSNRLTSLPDGSFSACPGLTELYLEKNAIDSLSNHTFSGLTKLEILELSSNRIKVLPELMLHPLPAIETLYLENNKIKVMPDNWFSQKEEVPYLYLSANPWGCSCSLGYFRRYLDDYEFNVYVRDGVIINSNVDSVVCDSPPWYKNKPVMSLEESELCSSEPAGDFYQPEITSPAYETTTAALPQTTVELTTPARPRIPTTPPITTAATFPLPATSAPAPTPTTFEPELHTVYHRVVTWSWYQTITRIIEWSNYSRSVVSEVPSTSNVQPTLPPVRRSTKSPIKPTTTTPVPSTITSTTPNYPTTTTIPTPTTIPTTTTTTTTTPPTTAPSWAIDAPGGQQRGKSGGVVGAGVFCLWLFAGCLLLCTASGLCILATLARLIIWYRRVYKPLCAMLTRGGGVREGIRLLTFDRREEKEMTGGGGGGGGGGVMALYRSVLFINREKEEGMEGNGGGEAGEGGGEGGEESLLVTLEPTGGEGGAAREGGERKAREERGVYRKTLYRLLSKEEEIEGWRDVMEECQISAEDGGRGEGGRAEERRGGRVSSKRYSVILREEREEAGGGREELDWVVGGWEVKGGGGGGGGGGEDREECRSSWGEWLAHHLPSLPWGVTTPPEGGAAQ